ncbi:MAG: hypothetical protein R3290_12520, partial [Acidimicrobiia bacterium]|nr:hypothetical protein [Acidimicrobiia bacterium]
IEESDEALEEDDPTAIWDEFQTTLEASVRDVVLDVYTMLAERAEAVAARVEEHFSDDEPDVIGSVAGAWEGLDEVDVKDPAAATDEPGRVASTLTALRGSYSGILMFNMLGGLLGLPAILPVTMVLGLFMGAKAMRDQKQKQLKAARQAARQSVRKYVDSVNQQVGKDIQDTLRRLQRELRDRFTERATEVQQTAVEALTAAKQSVEADRDRRSARLADLDAELRRLDALRSQAAALDPGATS